ncbi:MAG: hypothetical protein M1366_06655 [Patescibacteria group bacterium]|nr:hypothetical protein [Patescibacteria group bacterium]
MTDFISMNKPLGILLAKSSIGKSHLDELLKRENDLSKQLIDIGYTLHLKDSTGDTLKKVIEKELQEAKKMIDWNQHIAEVFSTILTSTLKKMAEKSKEDTHIMYHLSQIIFLWDEFIDFEDYQGSNGSLEKIRESIYYRAAVSLIQDITDDELEMLEEEKNDKKSLERILPQLQLSFNKSKYRSDQYLQLISALNKLGLSRNEMIILLLTLESALFIRLTEELINKTPHNLLSVFSNIDDLKTGINKTKEIFQLDEDALEKLLQNTSEELIMNIGIDIFL